MKSAASISWKPQCLSRPLQGLLHLLIEIITTRTISNVVLGFTCTGRDFGRFWHLLKRIYFQLTELTHIDTGFYSVFRPISVVILWEYSYSSAIYNDYFTIYCSRSCNVIKTNLYPLRVSTPREWLQIIVETCWSSTHAHTHIYIYIYTHELVQLVGNIFSFVSSLRGYCMRAKTG